MPKSSKPKKTATKAREFYSLQPCKYRVAKGHAEILAYVEGSDWEKALTVHPTSGASAESLAAYVTAVINEHQGKSDLLHDAMRALESVMEEGLNFSTEQDADHVIARIKGKA
jgi:hypothetical protein